MNMQKPAPTTWLGLALMLCALLLLLTEVLTEPMALGLIIVGAVLVWIGSRRRKPA